MKKNLILIMLLSIMMFSYSSHGAEHDPITAAAIDTKIEEASLSPLTIIEKRVRDAAVKVNTANGHGSGTYIVQNGLHMVITAAHVAYTDSFPVIEGEDGEKVNGRTIYADPIHDIGVILITKMSSKSPIRFKHKPTMPSVGEKVTYSGYPSHHSLLTFRGYVTGFENSGRRGDVILIHSYGWPGVSGSGLFDEMGNFVGVIFAIDAGEHFSSRQLIEDIVWCIPIQKLEMEIVFENACKLRLENKYCQQLLKKNIKKRFEKIRN